MRAIFVSYRRDDSEGEAGRLFDDLVGHFGEDSVFMDVAAIEAGRDFRKAIDESVATCGVLLAMIGKNWTDAKNEAGQRRLDDPFDFVRLETASALKRDIPVVPVLVHGAKMPRADQLPDDLKELAYRNGVELTHARWNSDLQLLIKALRPHVEDRKNVAASPSQAAAAERKPPVRVEAKVPEVAAEPSPASAKKPTGMILAVVAAVLVVGVVVGYMTIVQKRAAEQQRVAAEQKTLADKAAADRAAAEQTLADKAAADRTAAEQKAIADKAAADRAAADRALAEEKALADKAAADRAAADRAAAQKAAADRAAEQKAAGQKAAEQKAANQEHTVLPPNQERTVLTTADMTVKVVDRGQYVEFYLAMLPTLHATIRVDVNQNGILDTGDTSYDLAGQTNSPCTQYLLSESASTTCGKFVSRATVVVANDGVNKKLTWRIPKSELSATGKSVHFLIRTYGGTPPRWQAHPSESFAKSFIVEFGPR
jgi:TIR domain-containing protein